MNVIGQRQPDFRLSLKKRDKSKTLRMFNGVPETSPLSCQGTEA